MENQIVVPDFSRVVSAAELVETPKEMLTVRWEGSQAQVRVNSSSLALLQTCLRKSQYSLFEGWRSKAPAPALTYGKAIHKALEVFYLHTAREREMPEAFEERAALMAYGHAAPEKHFLYEAVSAFVKEAQPLRMLPDTDKRSIASGVWVLTHYFKTYLNDTYVIHCDDRGPITERTFSVLISEDRAVRIELFGTIDFALRNEVTGEVLIGDHKTASQMGADFLNRIKPNHQYTGYVVGAQRALGVTGEHFLVNGLQVKARPLTARGGPPLFTRQITRRTPDDVQEFIIALGTSVYSYLAAIENKSWPLGHVDVCAAYGACPYLEVCSAPWELRRNILENKFQRFEH